ncbi:hypothetical protein KR018_004255 [Drosophila ironensis]|nr:hypothetical protein KR018_004255 [Drosophila ironensis]
MQPNKPALLLLALAISASCVAADPDQGLLDKVFEDLGEYDAGVARDLLAIAVNSSAWAGEVGASFRNSSSENFALALQYGVKIADSIHRIVEQGLAEFSCAVKDAVTSLRNSLSSVTDRVKRLFLTNALKSLQNLQNSTDSLEASLSNFTTQLEEAKGKYQEYIEENWNLWTEVQLERVDEATNGQGSDEAEEILNELQNRYSDLLISCLQDLQLTVSVYEKGVHEAVSKYHNATDVLIAQIELCLDSSSSRRDCSRAIGKATLAIQPAFRDLLKLKLRGVELLDVALDARGCVAQTLAEHELEKPKVLSELDEIIERYLNQNSTSTESDSSATTNSDS